MKIVFHRQAFKLYMDQLEVSALRTGCVSVWGEEGYTRSGGWILLTN